MTIMVCALMKRSNRKATMTTEEIQRAESAEGTKGSEDAIAETNA